MIVLYWYVRVLYYGVRMGTYTKYETDTWSSVKVMGWKEKIMNYFEGGQTEQENLKRRPLYFALHEGGGGWLKNGRQEVRLHGSVPEGDCMYTRLFQSKCRP